ncbi:hypothetical protein NDA18_002037 [Ustilago nuda]|nr:hypothetical protein NDA18_002037 [Ustilago nuda]
MSFFFCSCFRLGRGSWLSGCECCACLLACLRKANASAVQQAATVLTGIDPIAGATRLLASGRLQAHHQLSFRPTPSGKLTCIAVIQGNNLDGGTLFGQNTLNSSAQFETWVRSAAVIYNTSYVDTALQQVFEIYPDVSSEASPYYNAETAT